MNEQEKAWQQFLEGHEDFEEDFLDDDIDDIAVLEKHYELTLFSGESNGYYLVFNTEIDIFQFVNLLHYYFGIDGIDVGRFNKHHNHSYNIDDDDEEDDID